mmetsp:Transcript_27176/g.54389  ORF Transcript_27176/g.54389 Transcript_27176/m.54389 type:complete len:838 (+) Transcript_27176:117-2630(+)
MFGVSRNKKKPLANKTIRTTASSSEDDDDDEEHRRRNLGKKRDKNKSKKKKMKIGGASSAVGLSFGPEEEEDHGGGGGGGLLDVKSSSKKRKKHSKQNSSSSSKKSSKKSKRSRGGFGYGGGMMIPSDESASDAELNQDQNNNSSSQYDVAALQKLKMEQKHGKNIVGDDSNNDKKNQAVKQQEEVTTEKEIPHVEKEEEFISLADTTPKHNRLDPIVLTGDEALAFAEKDEEEDPSEFDHGLKAQTKQAKPESTEVNEQIEEEVEEGNRQWEDTMARRAGVFPSSSTYQHSEAVHHHRKKVTSNSSSIAEIKGSLQPTINNLENVSSDLATSVHRQQSAIASTKDELAKHRSTLQDHGKALEYYQGLRVDLATWMGALRELDSMISLAEEAQRRWEVDVTWKKLERFFEWGEDCTSVLEKHGLLESKFTCADDSEADQTPQVDEFGRVVSSKAAMARMKRLDRRQKMQSQRLRNVDNDMISSCINEDNFDVREVDEWKQRNKAVNDAVALIPNSVNEDYRSIANLDSLFLEWQRLYPEDYKSSFAQMSLVKMASVLVRLELCQRWNLLGLSRSIGGESQLHVNEISEFRWFQCFKSNNGTSLTKDVLLQIIEKEIVARLLRSLSFYNEAEGGESTEHLYGVYNPFSADQTKHMCAFLKSMLGYMSTEETGTSNSCEKTIESVSVALLSLVRKCIERMTIPVLNPSNIKRETNKFVTKDGAIEFDSEKKDAIAYASVVQAKELCTLVTNMLQFWYPIIRDKAVDLLKFVFTDIISHRIIPVIQTLQTISNECNCDLGKTLISDVLDAASGLLDEEEWMLQAAPLRVAAQTMGLSSGK